MAITSTVAGIFLSVPIGLGAARNISILPVYMICRTIIVLSRTLNEIIIALLMVAIFGFGPFAGFIALSFASIGFLAKLLAENIENCDKSQLEAVKSTGASWLQWLNYSVQPQFMPRLVGLGMYRLDTNFRHSSVVGLVGAGGIGATLNTAFERYEFDTAAAINHHYYCDRLSTGICIQFCAIETEIMPVSETSKKQKVWQRRERKRQLIIWFGWLVGVALFMYCWQFISEATNWFLFPMRPALRVISGGVLPHRNGHILTNCGDLCGIRSILQHWALLSRYFSGTRRIFSSKKNTTPSKLIARPLALLIIVSSRSINSIIWAVLFVTIIGPGVFAACSPSACARLVFWPNYFTRPLKKSM